jgi:hypothetical protein
LSSNRESSGGTVGRRSELHRRSASVVYIKDLERVDLGILEKIVAESYGMLSAGTYRHRAAESQEGRPDA